MSTASSNRAFRAIAVRCGEDVINTVKAAITHGDVAWCARLVALLDTAATNAAADAARETRAATRRDTLPAPPDDDRGPGAGE